MPRRVTPMLAMLATLPADESAYAFEYKWDGIRAICFWDGDALRLQSRNLLDITHRYPELWSPPRGLRRRRMVLDGEIVALNERGQPSFNLLQRRMHVTQAGHLPAQVPATYMVFDILYLDAYPLLPLPYSERREILESLPFAGHSWQMPPSYPGEGHSLLSAATQTWLEGIVAKRLVSLYQPGRRGRDWLKIKVTQRQELVIGGWMPGEGAHRGLIGSLLVGYYSRPPRRGQPGVLHFAGGVGTGFDAEDHRQLLGLLAERRRKSSPFAEKIPRKGALWVKPELVAEVQFMEWTPGGIIRHPAFKGLREDKRASEVVREQAGALA